MSRIALPDLRVVAMDQIVLHEDADERRVSALTQRLQAEGVVKNPPVVAPLDAEQERFVVLDGANRTSALRILGVPDIVVQVCDYAEVELSTWHHLVTGADDRRLREAIDAIEGLTLEQSDLDVSRSALQSRSILAYLVLPDGQVFQMKGGSDLRERSSLLCQAVAVYKGRANIQRVQADAIDSLIPHFDEISGLIVFPRYEAVEILEMARQEAKLPSGITHHLIPLRALRTNTLISFLWDDLRREEKNRYLAEWTRHKLQAREIRFYEEATVLYDE